MSHAFLGPRSSALGLLTVLSLGLSMSVMGAEESTGDEPSLGERLFALQVRPILREKCFACHSETADPIEGGFDLSNRQALLAGGDAFGDTVLIPGDAAASSLMTMVSREEPGYEMPPKESERLSQEEVWAIRDWINAGAPWPDDARVAEIYDRYAEGVTVATSGGLSEQWTQRKYKPEDLWAWQPIRHQFDVVDDPDRSAIDQLIERQLTEGRWAEHSLPVAPPADRATLIRRATFDLLGLPPTPAEVQSFLNDSRSDQEAFAAVVDRLLDSDHYGEQAARHWLDVTRYADSSGYANDWERPNAWRYRDYVIRAFNDDKPYDQFTIEQIAGDELWQLLQQGELATATAIHPDVEQVHPSELLIAPGFLRMGPWEHTAMSVAKVTRQLFLDDITDSVGQVFLAQPLQCCRCHDHKFDPIPTRDYYSLQAVFATTQFAEVDADWTPRENRSGMEQDRHYLTQRHQANQAMLQRLDQQQAEYERQWFAERGLPYKSTKEAKRAGLSGDQLPGDGLRTPDEFGQERIGRKWRSRFQWEFDRYRPIAFSVYSGKTPPADTGSGRTVKPQDPLADGELEQTAILTGGDPFAAAESVDPGVLSAVPGADGVQIPTTVSGRRLALARWIASPDNPLTARVLVNRIWMHHFGRGIAGNPNNFGATGRKPTHPELLDYLAHTFVRDGWSVKQLHRRIMNSDAYRRSTIHPQRELLDRVDSNADSYAVFLPRRLEAEELRDAMLSVSGELNPALGGIPIRPDMNLEAALQPRMIMGTFAPSYLPNPQPADRNRRSIYIHNLRGHRLPMMETFNQPGSDKSCELRDQSNITPQVFTLINGEETNDRALALAADLLATGKPSEEVVDRLFLRLYGRAATDDQRAATLEHWDQMTKLQRSIEPPPRSLPTEVVRRAIDENTGQPFQFTERLLVYEDYQSDLQRSEVDARTRALGNVCLMLLNSNEFIYVY